MLSNNVFFIDQTRQWIRAQLTNLMMLLLSTVIVTVFLCYILYVRFDDRIKNDLFKPLQPIRSFKPLK